MANPKQTDDPIEFRIGALLSDIRSRMPETDSPASKDEYISEIKELVEAGLKQAREDAFDTLRTALRSPGDDDRWTFVNYCLTGAIESGHAGSWMLVTEYSAGLDDTDLERLPGLPTKERRAATATIIETGDDYLDDQNVRKIIESGKACAHCGIPIQSDGAAEGFCPRNQESDAHQPEQVLFKVTHETIELGLQRIRHAVNVADAGPGNWESKLTSVPHLHQGQRNAILQADLANDAGALDVNDYLAILEVALFNEVRYA